MEPDGGGYVITSDSLRYELEGRFAAAEFGKVHISVRWEPGPAIVRVGACISEYTWERRMQALDLLLRFESDHADEFAVEFDIVPLEAVQDEAFAEA